MTPIKAFYKTQSTTIINNLNKRHIDGYYCSTANEAKCLALSLIKEGSTVSFGGSMTINDIGLLEDLRCGPYNLLDRGAATNRDEVTDIYRQSFSANTYFMSTNALTLDGQLVNIDGTGNRVAALIYGPDQVIVIAGMNKVSTDVDEAIKRVKNFASPANTQRLERETPCNKTGYCNDCQTEDCICSNTVITRRSIKKGRIKVILVGEVLGY